MADFSRTESTTELHWTTQHILPCVYLSPPEEDAQNIIRIFPNSVDPFSTLASDDAFYEFPDPMDDDDEERQYQTYANSYPGLAHQQGTRRSLSRAVRKAQPYKTINKKRNYADHHEAVYRVQEPCGPALRDEEVLVPSPSRRSSVFEDRSSSVIEPDSFNNFGTSSESRVSSSLVSSSKQHSLLKEKAIAAFDTLRRQSLRRRKEQQVLESRHSEPPLSITSEVPFYPLESKRKDKRRSLLRLFNPSSNFDIIDITGTVENHTQSPECPPLKEKGRLTSFGLRRPTRPSVVDSSTRRAASDEGLAPVSGESKLSRRKSITQIFNRKRLSKTDHLQGQNHSISRQQIHNSPSSSILVSSDDVQADPAFAKPPPGCRQSVSESETGEDEPKSPVIFQGSVEMSLEDDLEVRPTDCKPIPLDMEKIADLSNRFSIHIDNASTDTPIMELAVQLNSLDFNHLEPGAYSDINDDE